LTKIIESDPDLEVIDTARDGQDAIDKTVKLKPDLITLDIEMPVMNGLDALRHIMAQCPTSVIMVSSLTTEGSRETLKALRLGASDFVAKDASFISQKIDALRDELIAKIKAIGGHRQRVAESAGETKIAKPTSKPPVFKAGDFDLVAIGSSTGGPPVVETIARSLTAEMSAPVVIAQHMPGVFTKSLSERLNAKCVVDFHHGEDGMTLKPGSVYLAPGGKQMRVHRLAGGGWALRINNEPADALYKPSVDVFFSSVAQAVGERTLGLMLTGMGDDGVKGARLINDQGGTILTQSADTCIVYGMPKAVDEAGVSAASLSPRQLCETLATLQKSGQNAEPSVARRRAG